MADLQSCYFCGTASDVQEYAVVPPRFGGDGRSAPLCEQCKGKLIQVIEPLIEQVENGASSGDAATADAGQPTSARERDDGGITMSSSDDGAGSSGPGGDVGASDEEGTDSAAPSGSSSEAPDSSSPPQYRRAMRMLSNRAFPIERTEVESMLANAYDLEREEVDAVISHAIKEGRLIEENGELREP